MSNKKIRQAFFYAVDRQKIIENIPGNIEPAYSPLPKEITAFSPTKYVEIENKQKARQCFAKGLKQLGLSREAFPKITINLSDNELLYRAVSKFKEQIEEVLGIQCVLLKFDYHQVRHKMERGDYEISALKWNAWINDPLYALEFFSKKNNRAKFVNWKNAQYQSLLERARTTKSKQQQSKILAQAEKVLIDNYVVLSFFYKQDIVLNHSNFEIDHLD